MYTATVRVAVRGCPPKADVGCSFVSQDTPEAHEAAYKGAVTDALKRGLRHFGDKFGLRLYDRRSGLDAIPVLSRSLERSEGTPQPSAPPSPAKVEDMVAGSSSSRRASTWTRARPWPGCRSVTASLSTASALSRSRTLSARWPRSSTAATACPPVGGAVVHGLHSRGPRSATPGAADPDPRRAAIRGAGAGASVPTSQLVRLLGARPRAGRRRAAPPYPLRTDGRTPGGT